MEVGKLLGRHLGVKEVSDKDDDDCKNDSNTVDDDVRPHEDKFSEDDANYQQMASDHSADTDEDAEPRNALCKCGEILFNRSGEIGHVFQGVVPVQ